VTYILFAIGLVHVTWFLWGIYKIIDRNFMRKPKDLIKRYDVGGRPQWAVVTGATGDIGEELCKQLAQRGFNIALVGRSKSKLDTRKNQLKK